MTAEAWEQSGHYRREGKEVLSYADTGDGERSCLDLVAKRSWVQTETQGGGHCADLGAEQRR